MTDADVDLSREQKFNPEKKPGSNGGTGRVQLSRSLAILELIPLLTDQYIVQRVLSGRDMTQGRRITAKFKQWLTYVTKRSGTA